MSLEIRFCAIGDPKGQPRPRAFHRGGHASVYDPGTAEEWKSCVAIAAKPYLPAKPWECPVSMEVTFYFKRPKSHFRKNGDLRDGSPIWMTKKPDVDNAAKAILDALTILGMWTDDDQVCRMVVFKRYADLHQPGAVVLIKELTDTP